MWSNISPSKLAFKYQQTNKVYMLVAIGVYKCLLLFSVSSLSLLKDWQKIILNKTFFI